MFFVPLFSIELENWENRKQAFKDLCKIDDPKYKNEAQYSDYHEHRTVEGCHYKKEFEELAKEELHLIQDKLGGPFYIDGLWFQMYEKTNYMPAHNHGSVGYSSVLFVDFDSEEHSATNFLAPFNDFIHGTTLGYQPEVKEGTMIFFPSVILHDVLPNKSTKQRTIISFNLYPLKTDASW